MESFLQQFQHLRIQLEEITSATDNFNMGKYIGVGGFGKVYKGELSHSKGQSTVAIKRLDPKHGQGIPEFLKEITTLSRYSHKNLISLLGFCYQDDEMILVYDYASRGSLDRYLKSTQLTWSQRIKICLDAAKGLRYLHDPGATHQRLIHCDVKSANILLDEQWNGKISDFGLSTMGPANELHSVIVILAAGTPGYCDPQYAMTHTLTKESDVYSFGVVLFEVLSGKLCCTYSNGRVQQNLVRTWIESYEEKKLNDIIFKDPTIQPLEQSVLEIFSDIAYRCLKESREDRPMMGEVVTELETALENQEIFQSQGFSEFKGQLFSYEEMTKTAESPLIYKSELELWKLLSKGVLLNGGKTWFSINKKGEHCEMISIAECLGSDDDESYRFSSANNSRFAMGTYQCINLDENNEITNVRTQLLSPGITYTVNLVFKFELKKESRCEPIFLRYKLQGEKESSISHLAYEREDGWWMWELYQFTCDNRIVHLQILFEGVRNFVITEDIHVEGIEFQPLENLEHIDEKQHISYSDSYANWEEKWPPHFEDIMKRSENSMQWTTKEEAYSIIRKGFLIIDDKTRPHIWFSVDKNGKKCHMLPAKAALKYIYDSNMLSLPESRFGEVVHCDSDTIYIKTEVQSQLVSSKTTYACYLVYKLPKDQSGFKAPIEVDDIQNNSGDRTSYIYLVSAQTPVIKPKDDQNTHNPVNWLKSKCLPRQRNDGWMEIQIWEWRTTTTTIYMNLRLKLCDRKKFDGLIIEGIEYRPI